MTILHPVMAKYRRQMDKIKQKYIIDKYKKHCDAEGGTFRPDKRRKLVGLKKKNPKQIEEGTADFWYDVRKSAKHSLTDLQLVSEVANTEQLREIFSIIPYGEWNKDTSKTDLVFLIRQVLGSQPWRTVRYKKGVPQPSYNSEDDSWLAFLAYQIVHECFEFFKDHQLVTSKAHERLIDEVDDLLNSEVGRADWLARNQRNVRW